jgi:hypothetical protein
MEKVDYSPYKAKKLSQRQVAMNDIETPYKTSVRKHKPHQI